MKKGISFIILIQLFASICFGQVTIDSILRQVEAGNKSNNSNKKNWSAKKLEF
jgi:hypothetical protein